MVDFRTRVEKFLNAPDIRQLVEDSDLDAVYVQYIDRRGWANELTAYLLEHDVDPLEYVSKIHKLMYADRKELFSIVIPSSVSWIEDEAFLECTNLKSISIPETVKIIGNNAFGECINLDTVYYAGDKRSWRKIRMYGAFDGMTDIHVHCSDGVIYPEEL